LNDDEAASKSSRSIRLPRKVSMISSSRQVTGTPRAGRRARSAHPSRRPPWAAFGMAWSVEGIPLQLPRPKGKRPASEDADFPIVGPGVTPLLVRKQGRAGWQISASTPRIFRLRHGFFGIQFLRRAFHRPFLSKKCGKCSVPQALLVFIPVTRVRHFCNIRKRRPDYPVSFPLGAIAAP